MKDFLWIFPERINPRDQHHQIENVVKIVLVQRKSNYVY